MLRKKCMAAGLAVVVLATGIPGNFVQAKAKGPSLIAKKTITVEKYPVGVIDEMDAKVANQSYLKDIVYIRCVRMGGGVLAPIYHANVVTDYRGNDWVAKDAFTEEIGRQFTSGTGKEYKVVAIENNTVVDGGRTRVVLETEDGKRWMIQNIPAFEYDSRTGITYYDIYEYVSDPDYVSNTSI